MSLFDTLRSAAFETEALVVGDLMVDQQITTQATVRPCPEDADVRVAELVREERFPGGAANVAQNLGALLLKRTALVGTGGRCGATDWLASTLLRGHVAPLIDHQAGAITMKSRLYRSDTTGILARWDRDVIRELDFGGVSAELERRPGQYGLLLLSDYGKGAFAPERIQDVLAMVQRYRTLNPSGKVCLNGKPALVLALRHANGGVVPVDLLQLNAPEFHELYGLPDDQRLDEFQTEAGRLYFHSNRLRQYLGLPWLVHTRGDWGLLVVGERGYAQPAYAGLPVRSVVGAGDATFALASLALSATGQAQAIAHAANAAGAAKVTKAGTCPVRWSDLDHLLPHVASSKENPVDAVTESFLAQARLPEPA